MTDFLTATVVARDADDAMHHSNAAVRDDTSSDDELDGPRRKVPVHKKTREEIFLKAVLELGGMKVNSDKETLGETNNWSRFFGILSFVCACAANIIGIFNPWENIDGTYRSFSLMAAVFMINQSFMFVKTIRDGEITSMKDHHNRIPPEFHFLQGGMPGEMAPHRAVCFSCLLLSIAAEAYGILVMDAKSYTQMFIALSSLYILSSSLNLGWLLRDRFEAEVWMDEKRHRFIGSNKVELAVRNMVKVLCNMQSALKFMFAFCGLMAIAINIYALIDFGVKEKGVGLLSAGMVMAVASAWSMAEAWNSENYKDTAHWMHRAATAFFFVAAVVLTTVGLLEMEIDPEYELPAIGPRKAVLGLGVIIILDGTLNFAKVVYKGTQVKKLVKLIKKGFHIDINMEDFSQNIFDKALDTFATATMDAGRDTGPYAGYVYGDAHGSAPPPPEHGHGNDGYMPTGQYEPMHY